MSEVCEICGREKHMPQGCWREHHSVAHDGADPEDAAQCYRLGYERTLARADRSEAEFSACKALLIAAQQRAERAEAERAEARARSDRTHDWYEHQRERADKAHAALEEVETWLAQTYALMGDEGAIGLLAIVRTALAALPVEPARRQVTDIANALDTPAAGCSEEKT